MRDLRAILLIIGVLFIAGLFVWERRKRRDRGLASQGELIREPSMSSDMARFESVASSRAAVWDPDMSREPTINLPQMRAREPAQPLPVVEFAADGPFDRSTAGLAEAGPLEREPAPEVAHEAAAAPPARSDGEAPPAEARAPSDAAGSPADGAALDAAGDAPAAASPALPPVAPGSFAPPLDPASLRLEWPQEAERVIIAVRIVPNADRFLGRTVRQALAGEGFIHGPLGIFHRALADGRVVLSAASLTKPGSFNLASMDSQRYAGINLFGVLPGPLPGASTLEDLVTVSRTLAARLGGQVQDEHGQPLGAARIAEIKAGLAPAAQGAARAPAAQGADPGERRG